MLVVDGRLVEEDEFADAFGAAYDDLSEIEKARLDKVAERFQDIRYIGKTGALELLARIGAKLTQRPDIRCHFDGGRFVGFSSSEKHPAGLSRIPNDEVPVPFCS
jgi:hypothetical protein